MRRSDAEQFLQFWDSSTCKVFRYLRPLVPNEYVVFRKLSLDSLNAYEPAPEKSTYICLKTMDEETFIKALLREEFIYVKDWTWQTDTRQMKTGGCTCGAWAVRESERIHDAKCPLHHRMFM